MRDSPAREAAWAGRADRVPGKRIGHLWRFSKRRLKKFFDEDE